MSEISSGVPPQASAAVVDSAQCIYQLGILLGIGRFDTYEEVQSTWSEVGIYRTFTLVDQYREQALVIKTTTDIQKVPLPNRQTPY